MMEVDVRMIFDSLFHQHLLRKTCSALRCANFLPAGIYLLSCTELRPLRIDGEVARLGRFWGNATTDFHFRNFSTPKSTWPGRFHLRIFAVISFFEPSHEQNPRLPLFNDSDWFGISHVPNPIPSSSYSPSTLHPLSLSNRLLFVLLVKHGSGAQS